MRPGKLVYISDAPQGLPPMPPQKLSVARKDIQNIELSCHSGRQLRITILLGEGHMPEHEEVCGIYDAIVMELVDHISFELDCPLDLPIATSYEHPSGSAIVLNAKATDKDSASGRAFVFNPDDFRKRLSALPPSTDLLQEYNAVAHIQNPIHQYLAFWGLLAKIVEKDSVAAIDKYLNSQEIPISYEKNTDRNGKVHTETKFGLVRNKISHPADRGVKLADLPEHVNEILPELRNIVRMAISGLSKG